MKQLNVLVKGEHFGVAKACLLMNTSSSLKKESNEEMHEVLFLEEEAD